MRTVPYLLPQDSGAWLEAKAPRLSPRREVALTVTEKGRAPDMKYFSMAVSSHASVGLVPDLSCHVLLAGVTGCLIPAEVIKNKPVIPGFGKLEQMCQF